MHEGLVMVTAGKDSDLIFENLISDAVFVIDASRPATFQFMLEWFRFANTF